MAERTKKNIATGAGENKATRQSHPPSVWAPNSTGAGGATRAGRIASEVGDAWVGAIAGVVGAGMGLVVSGTGDGGAVRIALLDDGETTKKYAGNADELAALLEDLRVYTRGLSDAGVEVSKDV